MIMSTSTSIGDLRRAEIAWVKEAGSPRWLGHFGGEKCELTMGDFPAEALYTLVWRGNSIEFDDTPEKWNLPRD
jgi:hypothetical protein